MQRIIEKNLDKDVFFRLRLISEYSNLKKKFLQPKPFYVVIFFFGAGANKQRYFMAVFCLPSMPS